MEVMLRSARRGRLKHTQRHREPFAVKSQLPREKAEPRHPFKTAYSAGTPRISRKVYDSFGAVAADIELCALRVCKSMYRENSVGDSVSKWTDDMTSKSIRGCAVPEIWLSRCRKHIPSLVTPHWKIKKKKKKKRKSIVWSHCWDFWVDIHHSNFNQKLV